MTNPAIQQTLIELEANLQKIESARKQVNSVTEKSEELIRLFSTIIQKVDGVSDSLTIDEEELEKKLNDVVTNLQQELSSLYDVFEKNLNNYNVTFENNQTELFDEVIINQKKFEFELSKNLTQLVEGKDLYLKELSQNNTQLLEKIKLNQSEFNKEIHDSKQLILSKQKEESSNFISDVASFRVKFEESYLQLSDDFVAHNKKQIQKITESSDEFLKILKKTGEDFSSIQTKMNAAFELKSNEQITILKSNSEILNNQINSLTNDVTNLERRLKQTYDEVNSINFNIEFEKIIKKIESKNTISIIVNIVLFLIVIGVLFFKK
jgi:hypothetical protein